MYALRALDDRIAEENLGGVGRLNCSGGELVIWAGSRQEANMLEAKCRKDVGHSRNCSCLMEAVRQALQDCSPWETDQRWIGVTLRS